MDYAIMSTKDENFNGADNYLNNNNNNQNINHNQVPNPNGMSKAELRKSNKPIMEKRRRARINHCLNELKSLILEAMKKDPARHTKLEKADILEMTVKHLQSVQRQQLSLAIQTDPTVIHKFKSGFTDCANEVNRYIGQLEDIDAATRQRLTNHINNCASGIEQIGTFSNFSSTYGFCGGSSSTNGSPSIFNNADCNNNNNNTGTGRISIPSGVQLIPSRLPTGELALIMPNSNTLPASSIFLSNPQHSPSIEFAQNFPRLSAFTKPSAKTVIPAISLQSPAAAKSPSSIRNLNATQTSAATASVSTATSPPLSPVSSISSLGCDDSSMMHTSLDFTTTKTPPPSAFDHSSTTDYFSATPSSAESMKFFSRTSSHLQQSLVSSTSESSGRDDDDFSILRKRSRSVHLNGDDEPAKKLLKIEDDEIDQRNGNMKCEKNYTFDENMWRPW